MSNSDLQHLMVLSGVALNEQVDAGAIATEPKREEELPVQKEVPADVNKALVGFIKAAEEAASKAAMQGQDNERKERMTVAAYATELKTFLDGSEEGFKRAATHLHTARNTMTNELPDVIVKYLSGNALESLNTVKDNDIEVTKKRLKDYMDELRNRSV